MLAKLLNRIPIAHRQFIAFCLVGGIGFFVDAGSFSILFRWVGLDRVTARVISMFVIAMTGSWLLNRSITFRDRQDQPLWREYLRFAAVNSIGNLANFGTHALLVETVPLFIRIPELAIVVGTAVGVSFNFTGSKYFVFRRAAEPPAKAA